MPQQTPATIQQNFNDKSEGLRVDIEVVKNKLDNTNSKIDDLKSTMAKGFDDFKESIKMIIEERGALASQNDKEHQEIKADIQLLKDRNTAADAVSKYKKVFETAGIAIVVGIVIFLLQLIVAHFTGTSKVF